MNRDSYGKRVFYGILQALKKAIEETGRPLNEFCIFITEDQMKAVESDCVGGEIKKDSSHTSGVQPSLAFFAGARIYVNSFGLSIVAHESLLENSFPQIDPFEGVSSDLVDLSKERWCKL